MPQPNKIVVYNLQERLLQLSAQPGMTDERIAELLTQELGGRDTISASSVSRNRRILRAERASETKAAFQEHVKGHLPADLSALEEVELWLLSIFRNQAETIQVRNPEMMNDPEIQRLLAAMNASECPAGFDLKTRGQAAMMAVKVIETKLKFSGILGSASGGESAAVKKADEILEELDEKLREKVTRALGTGTKAAGVPRPH